MERWYLNGGAEGIEAGTTASGWQIRLQTRSVERKAGTRRGVTDDEHLPNRGRSVACPVPAVLHLNSVGMNFGLAL